MRRAFLRLIDTVPTILVVLTLVFISLRILPGDPALAVLGDMADARQLENFRVRHGLNDPLWKQYFDFLRGVATLDFGRSMITNTPVSDMIRLNLPYTIELTAAAMLLGTVIGIPLGVLAASYRNQAPDSMVRGLSLFGYAIPDFYMGAVLLIVFSLHFGWFPISGGGSDLVSRLHHLVLPAITLTFVKSAFISRLTRASLLDVMRKDYIRTARAKGAGPGRVIFRHGLRNALLPLSTGIGLSLLATLSGSVAIELVFNRPGVGKMLITGIIERDYAVVQAGIVIFALCVIAVNLVMDLLYVVIDPRTKGESQ